MSPPPRSSFHHPLSSRDLLWLEIVGEGRKLPKAALSWLGAVQSCWGSHLGVRTEKMRRRAPRRRARRLSSSHAIRSTSYISARRPIDGDERPNRDPFFSLLLDSLGG